MIQLILIEMKSPFVVQKYILWGNASIGWLNSSTMTQKLLFKKSKIHWFSGNIMTRKIKRKIRFWEISRASLSRYIWVLTQFHQFQHDVIVCLRHSKMKQRIWIIFFLLKIPKLKSLFQSYSKQNLNTRLL